MKIEAEDSTDDAYSDHALNRQSTWLKTTTMNTGYGSAVISAPNNIDFSRLREVPL
jgi:hypothetical protein